MAKEWEQYLRNQLEIIPINHRNRAFLHEELGRVVDYRNKLKEQGVKKFSLGERINKDFGSILEDNFELMDIGMARPRDPNDRFGRFVGYEESIQWKKHPMWDDIIETLSPVEKGVITRSLKQVSLTGISTVGELRSRLNRKSPNSIFTPSVNKFLKEAFKREEKKK